LELKIGARCKLGALAVRGGGGGDKLILKTLTHCKCGTLTVRGGGGSRDLVLR
jgi:hypothetical protein